MRLLNIGPARYILCEGDIFIINLEEPHAIAENKNPEHDYIVVSFNKSLIDKYLKTSGFHFKNIIDDQEISEILCDWFNVLLCKDIPDSSKINIQPVIERLCLFQKEFGEKEKQSDSIKKIKDILDNEFSDNHSIESLANKAFLSPFHFSRIFKRHTGMAPHQYLLDNRLQQARKLLGDNFQIIDIAIACGFYDASHFIRHFTNYYGVPPLKYQKGTHMLKA